MKRSSGRSKSRSQRTDIDQLAADLRNAPVSMEWVRRRQERTANAMAANAEAADLYASLLRDGFAVKSIADLYNNHLDYRSEIPLLLQWLPKTQPPVQEAILRALTIPAARPAAASPILFLFDQTDDEDIRWACANALEVVADTSLRDEVTRRAVDASNGMSRQMLVLALGRVGDRSSVPALLKLLDDPAVAGQAIVALGKLGFPEALPALEPFHDHEKAWIRAEARKSTERIRRATGQSIGHGARQG